SCCLWFASAARACASNSPASFSRRSISIFCSSDRRTSSFSAFSRIACAAASRSFALRRNCSWSNIAVASLCDIALRKHKLTQLRQPPAQAFELATELLELCACDHVFLYREAPLERNIVPLQKAPHIPPRP